jgi:hypothetical protein
MEETMSNTVVFAKIASLPKILEAAQLLYELGLQTEQPNETVKRYVLANPDINKAIVGNTSPSIG